MRETSNSLSKQNSQQPKQFRGGEKKVMKKSLLAFVLAFSLVLSVAVPAFAATPTDVVGKKEQSAVEELIALGVINGYQDGTFRPDRDISRAELAKIIVVATGNESAAKLMASVKSSFSDVKTTDWANGYINAAAAKGIIQGYNGKFRPNDNVKFEEVVAILVRALGYKESQLSGAWPYNYLLAAQDTKPGSLYAGLDITPGVNANRGIVAQLVSNTVNSAQVTYGGLNADVLVYGDKLVTKLGNATSGILTNSVLDSNKNISVNGSVYATSENFVVTGGKKLSELAGREITVITVGGKVAAITDKQSADKTVTGVVKTATSSANNATIALKDVTTTYTVAADALYFKNGVKQAANAALNANASVSLYLDAAGKVRAINAVEYTHANKLFVSYAAATSYSKAKINVNGAVILVDDNTAIKLNGVAAKATDLAVDDVIDAVVGDGVAVTVEATRSSVQGTVTSKATTSGTISFTINGTAYQTVDNTDLGGTVEVTTTERIYVLNKDNKIVKVKAVAGATLTNKNGIVIEVVNDVAILDGVQVVTKDKVTFYNLTANEKQVVYVSADTFTGATPAAAQAAGDAVKGHVLQFKFNAEGKATELVTPLAPISLAAAGAVTVDTVSATSIKTNTIYNINTNTVVVDAIDPLNPKAATLADVVAGKKVIVIATGINADVIAIVGTGTASASANITGLFVSATETVTATGSTYSVKLNVGGEEKTYTVTKAAFDDVAGEGIVAKNLVTLKADYTQLTKATAAAAVNTVDTNNSTFKVGTVDYVLTSNSKVFVIDKDGNVSVAGLDVVSEAADATVTTQYEVYVTDTTVTVGGTYKEVSTIVIVKKV